jgi:hypothetical protein
MQDRYRARWLDNGFIEVRDYQSGLTSRWRTYRAYSNAGDSLSWCEYHGGDLNTYHAQRSAEKLWEQTT